MFNKFQIRELLQYITKNSSSKIPLSLKIRNMCGWKIVSLIKHFWNFSASASAAPAQALLRATAAERFVSSQLDGCQTEWAERLHAAKGGARLFVTLGVALAIFRAQDQKLSEMHPTRCVVEVDLLREDGSNFASHGNVQRQATRVLTTFRKLCNRLALEQFRSRRAFVLNQFCQVPLASGMTKNYFYKLPQQTAPGKALGESPLSNFLGTKAYYSNYVKDYI